MTSTEAAESRRTYALGRAIAELDRDSSPDVVLGAVADLLDELAAVDCAAALRRYAMRNDRQLDDWVEEDDWDDDPDDPFNW